jgi:hypothetical protein
MAREVEKERELRMKAVMIVILLMKAVRAVRGR